MCFAVCRRASGTGFSICFCTRSLDPDMDEMMRKWLELHGGNLRFFFASLQGTDGENQHVY